MVKEDVMNRRALHSTVFVTILFLIACQGGAGNPTLPDNDLTQAPSHSVAQQNQTNLWGYWNISIDPDSMEVEIVRDRSAMFTTNVVRFLNENLPGLQIAINDTPVGPNYIDIDLDVSITHPFPGMPQFDGYDVRAVFMGDGSGTMQYNPDLIFPVNGTDQMMLPEPSHYWYPGSDGYTRWFNLTEFSTGGMPLFSYTEGKYATRDFAGTATLCPYMYFADGLGEEDDLWNWITANTDTYGVFTSGSTNTRNYYIRFPNAKGPKFGYAVVANWSGPAPDDHPSNAPEPVACEVDDLMTYVYYQDEDHKGGELNMEISIFDWGEHAEPIEDYKIYIESPVLSTPHEFTTDEMTPIDSGDNWYTYDLDIPADNVTEVGPSEYWIIVEMADHDYTNPMGVPNEADTDRLAACFRYYLEVVEHHCWTPSPWYIDPDSALTGTYVDDAEVTMLLEDLEDGPALAAWLEKDDSPIIEGTDLVVHDMATLGVDFDLAGAEPGIYDVVVVNGCDSEPGRGDATFEVLGDAGPLTLTDSGSLPDPLPYTDDQYFCVVGYSDDDHEGVYFFGEDFDLMYYPIDYSSDASLYMTIEGNFGFTAEQIFGAANELGAFEVSPSGGVFLTTHGTDLMMSSYPQYAWIYWFAEDTPAFQNGLTVDSAYGIVMGRDIEDGLENDAYAWGVWGVEDQVSGDLQLPMISFNHPYGSDSYGYGIDWAPLDLVGSVDGEVSDMEMYRLAVDSTPQGLTEDYDVIFYYLEGEPDDEGIEVFANDADSTGEYQLYLTTIDDVFVGTPVDIAVVNSYGNIPSAEGNWLCVLEDNGDSTWQVAVFDQEGTLIERVEPALDGDPLGLDCDNYRQDVHVWADNGGTLEYSILTW